MSRWCSGIENCLVPHIVLEANANYMSTTYTNEMSPPKLDDWNTSLNTPAKPSSIIVVGFVSRSTDQALNQHKQDAKIILETADGDKDQRPGLPMVLTR